MEEKHEQFDFWTWLRDKVVPSLIVTLCVGLFATYVQVVRLVDSNENTKTRITSVEQKLDAIQESYVKRVELLETVKRVEQQLEIVLLRAREDNNDRKAQQSSRR